MSKSYSAEKVAQIREKIKKEFPDSKFLISKSGYSGINITIMSAPIDLLKGGKSGTGNIINNYYIKESYKDNVEARDYLLKVYEIASEGVTWRETGDYGNQPSFYVYIYIGESESKPFVYIPSKKSKNKPTDTPKPKSSGNPRFEKGELLKECAGWDVYKKTLPDERIIYNAYKKKETAPNKEDWNVIKGDILTGTGFKWGRFGFEKWGQIASEAMVIQALCNLFAKYYGGKEEEKNKSSIFVYGEDWDIPREYGNILIETLKGFGFEIFDIFTNSFSIFKLNVDLTIYISDNGGEFNIVNDITKDFITSLNYTIGNKDVTPFRLAKMIEEIYIDNIQQTQPKNTNIPKFKIGDKVVRKFGNQVMTVVKQIYDNDQKMFDYDLVFENGMDVSLFENLLELYEEAPTQTTELSNEQINKLIKALSYLADEGDETAKKKMKAYKYLLN